jgi:uncharacterized protein YecT (DUF1311 family)
MTISPNLFLYENNPHKNLELLANFNASNPNNCTTESVYKKVPKSTISGSKLREISIVTAGFTALTLPFIFIAWKACQCGSLLWRGKAEEAFKCTETILDALGSPVHAMTYVSLLAGVAVLGTGAYAASRWYFQDKTKGERFECLDREYSKAAATLENQYRTAGKQEKEKIRETALKISDNAKLIYAALREAAKISHPQANLLMTKIARAAESIILQEERNQKQAKGALYVDRPA